MQKGHRSHARTTPTKATLVHKHYKGKEMRLLSFVATTVAAVAAYIPPNMELGSWTDVSQTQLTPLEFRSEVASALEGKDDVSESACIDAASVIRQHSGSLGCIAFAVRRPG
jgi:cytochrome c-type biogenesis protein CcmH/NrfG